MDILSNPRLLTKVAERLAAMADQTRLRLLLRLKCGTSNVTELTRDLKVRQASVSKHLAVLKQAGLVSAQRRGTQVFYRIQDKSVFEMCRIVCDGVVRHIQQESSVLDSDAN